MTTNTTKPADSQAEAISTFDNDEFWNLVIAYCKGVGCEGKSLVEYCDAKLAQANAAAEDFRHMAFLAANASRKAEARATAAEAQLASLRQKVYLIVEVNAGQYFGEEAVFRKDVLALLQPQAQADTSGLPG